MYSFWTVVREMALRAVAAGLFYVGAIKLVNVVANRWKLHNTNHNGKMAFPLIRKARARNVQILIYHRVNDDRDPFFPALPVETFRRQMEYLAENFNFLSLAEAVARLQKRDVPDNGVVITFDDGYRDNYVNAFPILKSLSIPATIFLTTDAIGSGRVIWHDRVFCAFRDTRLTWLAGIGGISRQYRLTTVEEKLLAQREFLQFVRSQKDEERLYWIDWLIKNLQVIDQKTVLGLMLSWDEARAMLRCGINFGSHTVSHPILSKQSVDQAWREIWQSKEELEKQLGVLVVTFAYPNGTAGDFNDTTKGLLREAGYRCAVTTLFGSNAHEQDLFELRRATPWDRELYSFALRLNWFKFAS
jgi:peptidoglycan/xylan/chitin deacetylase (PgdA/CDA1 family)